MSVLTIRMPESKHKRLKHLAKARGISINKLIEELSTIALAQHDAEVRFQARAARATPQQGLALLDKLDQAFAAQPTAAPTGALPPPVDRA